MKRERGPYEHNKDQGRYLYLLSRKSSYRSVLRAKLTWPFHSLTSFPKCQCLSGAPGNVRRERHVWGELMSRRWMPASGVHPRSTPNDYEDDDNAAAKWSRELEMRAGKDTAGISLYYVRSVIPGCERVNGRHKYCKNNGSVQLNRVISVEHRWPLLKSRQT